MRVPILVEVLRPETHGARRSEKSLIADEIILLQKRIPKVFKVVRSGIRTHDHSKVPTSLANIPFLFVTSPDLINPPYRSPSTGTYSPNIADADKVEDPITKSLEPRPEHPPTPK